MLRLIQIILISNIFFLNVKSQSNDYFIHNENWANVFYGVEFVYSSYTLQVGDTIFNNDTLIKLIQPFAGDGSDTDTTFFLAKSNLGKLYFYTSNSNFNLLGDSVIVDFSRSDSITSNSSQTGYNAKEINSIDTIYFGSVGKKIYRIEDQCGESDDDFVYEGVLGFYDGCFEYAKFLTCYSIFDTTYFVNLNTFSISNSVNCIKTNLGLKELNSENKKLIRIIDLMGRETIEKPNSILIYIYSDGTTEKGFRIE